MNIKRKFQEFHRRNPDILKHVITIALEAKALGFVVGSISLVWERLRWLYAIQTEGDRFKINNNHRAFYARLAMKTEPKLAGYFKTRENVSERHSRYEEEILNK